MRKTEKKEYRRRRSRRSRGRRKTEQKREIRRKKEEGGYTKNMYTIRVEDIHITQYTRSHGHVYTFADTRPTLACTVVHIC